MSASRSPVSAKWPRTLVPNWSSKPSCVSRRGGAITPALLTSRSRLSCAEANSPANARTDARLARSSGRSSSEASAEAVRCTSCSAFSPLTVSRQASATFAPLRASSRAVESPRPLLAPVTIAVRPVWSGICSLVHLLISFSFASIGCARDEPASAASWHEHDLAVRPLGEPFPRGAHVGERHALDVDAQAALDGELGPPQLRPPLPLGR